MSSETLFDLRNALTERDMRIAELENLLRLAVEDFDLYGEVINSPAYSAHPRYVDYCRIINVRTHRWRFAEQAQKLLGDEII
jgi:hypothetical protein